MTANPIDARRNSSRSASSLLFSSPNTFNIRKSYHSKTPRSPPFLHIRPMLQTNLHFYL